MIKKLKVRFYSMCCITLSVFGICYILQSKCIPERSLQTDTLIPNIIHYVLFNTSTINFMTYLSVISVIKIQKPPVIYIHTNKSNFTGIYWNKLKHTSSLYGVDIQVSFFILPTHVYGQRLSSIYHATDISRIFVLRKYGGIYLDTDMVIINNVNKLRAYECVIGWPKNDYIGSQFIMAKNSSEFLKLWQEGYKKYKPRNWYYNAGQYPTELLEKNPKLAHVETEKFGVQNLLDKLLSTETWSQWKLFYGIHVLYRHDKIFEQVNENSAHELPMNFANIAKWILELN